ncbi:MAG: phage tail sheath family protein [Clostridium sp.]|nr:phage tail sheath family protein [Clostridium sp.]
MLNHGINIIEKEDNIVVQKSASGVPVVWGTAPVHLTEHPENAVNRIVLCNNISEAKEKLGYSEDFEKYTLCQVMKMCFLEYAVAPIVFINVLDPTKHVKSFSSKTVTVEKAQATLVMDGVLLDSLTIEDSDGPLTKDSDYVLSRTDEQVVITLIGEKETSSLTVSGKQIDASAVTDLDVIGGYDDETGVETGIELIRQVYPSTNLIPGIMAAPGFSHHPVVGATLVAKCTNINGCFTAETVLDIDTTLCKKRNQLADAKKTAGFCDRSSYLIWPMAKRDGLMIYGSAVVIAATIATDIANGDIPNVTPSNKEAKIDAAVLADGTEVLVDFEQADDINKLGINTFLSMNGWNVWGNYTAAYPKKTAMNAKFWCIRRFFSWHGNNFIKNNLMKLDGVANKKLIETICDEENLRCNGYVSNGVCAAASISFLAEDNTGESISEGKLVFRQKLGVYGPAQQIENNLEYDAESVVSSLTE